MDLIQRALLRAYDAHKGQRRKISSVPYFVHLLDVAKYLMYETEDEEVICAGLLHDVLEDTDYSDVLLEKEFGSRVLSLVRFCTEPDNNVSSSDVDLKKSWKERKVSSVNKLDDASDDELLVFCADKVANLLSMKEDLINGVDIRSCFNASWSDIEWYYSEIQIKLKSRLGNRRIFRVYCDLMSIFNKTDTIYS